MITLNSTRKPRVHWSSTTLSMGILFLLVFSATAKASGYYNMGAFWRRPGCQGINFVQQVSNQAGYTTSPSTLTATLTPTTGHFLVAAVVVQPHAPGAAAYSQVSDSLGNTWSATPPVFTPSYHEVQIWYAPVVNGGSSDTISLATSHLPGFGFDQYLTAMEYSGIASTNVLDVTSGQSPTVASTTLTPGAMVITGGCDLVVADYSANGQAVSVGSTPETVRSVPSNSLIVDNAAFGSTAGQSVNLSATVAITSTTWEATQAGFVASGAAFTPPSSPTKLAFTTSAQSLNTWTCSGAITVQSQNASSTPTNTMTDITVNLSGTNVQFYYDSQCLLPASSTTIWAGSNSQSFYAIYSDTTSGLVTATPSGGYSAITQTETLSTNPFLWTGGASCDGNWSTGACWAGGSAPTTATQIAHFDNHCTTNCSATLSSSPSIGGLWLHSTFSSTVNLSSFSLTLSSKLPGQSGLWIDGGTLNGNTGTLTAGGMIFMDGGTFNGNSSNISAASYFTILNSSYFVPGTSTVTLTNSATVQDTMSFYNLTVSGSGVTYTSGTTITNNLVINSGGSFTTGSVTTGTENVTIGGNLTNNGSYAQSSTTGTSTTFTSGSHTIGGTNAPGFRTLNIQGPTTLNVGIVVGSNVTISSSLSSNGYPISLTGNWTNNGTYTAAGSEVVTLTSGASHVIGGSSATTFGGLAMDNSGVTTNNSITFPAGVTTTVTSSLTLLGNSSHNLSLGSSTPGTAWNFTPPASTTLGGHITVQDSDSSVTIHSGANFVNSGNNTGWVFP